MKNMNITKTSTSEYSTEELYQLSKHEEAKGDYLKSYEYLVAAAEKRHVAASIDLYRIFNLLPSIFLCTTSTLERQIAQERKEKYFHNIKAAADNGDALAQVTIGEIIDKGGEDPALALDYFKKAAAQGLAKGHYLLGCFVSHGKNKKVYSSGSAKDRFDVPTYELVCKGDKKLGQEHFEIAINKGYFLGNVDIGLSYLWGDGVPKNEVKAFQYLELAYKACLTSHKSLVNHSLNLIDSNTIEDINRALFYYIDCLKGKYPALKHVKNLEKVRQLESCLKDITAIKNKRFIGLTNAAKNDLVSKQVVAAANTNNSVPIIFLGTASITATAATSASSSMITVASTPASTVTTTPSTTTTINTTVTDVTASNASKKINF